MGRPMVQARMAMGMAKPITGKKDRATISPVYLLTINGNDIPTYFSA